MNLTVQIRREVFKQHQRLGVESVRPNILHLRLDFFLRYFEFLVLHQLGVGVGFVQREFASKPFLRDFQSQVVDASKAVAYAHFVPKFLAYRLIDPIDERAVPHRRYVRIFFRCSFIQFYHDNFLHPIPTSYSLPALLLHLA